MLTSQPGKQVIEMYMSNISISKANGTATFNQLIEYNMRNIFVENSYIKYGVETIA